MITNGIRGLTVAIKMQPTSSQTRSNRTQYCLSFHLLCHFVHVEEVFAFCNFSFEF